MPCPLCDGVWREWVLVNYVLDGTMMRHQWPVGTKVVSIIVTVAITFCLFWLTKRLVERRKYDER